MDSGASNPPEASYTASEQSSPGPDSARNSAGNSSFIKKSPRSLSVTLPSASNLGSISLVKAAEGLSQQFSPGSSKSSVSGPLTRVPLTPVSPTANLSATNNAAAECKAVLQHILLSPAFRQHSVAYLHQAAAQLDQV